MIPYWMSHQFWIHDHPLWFVLLCTGASLSGWATGKVWKAGTKAKQEAMEERKRYFDRGGK